MNRELKKSATRIRKAMEKKYGKPETREDVEKVVLIWQDMKFAFIGKRYEGIEAR